MTQDTYGPWIIWNATETSTNPVPGKKVQMQFVGSSGRDCCRLGPYESSTGHWDTSNLFAYRVLQEPETRTIWGRVFAGEGIDDADLKVCAPAGNSPWNIRLDFQVDANGEPIPGTFILTEPRHD